MDIERGFPLLEMLRPMMYSLESFKSLEWCIFLLFLTPFIGLSSLFFTLTSHWARAFALSVPLDFLVDLLLVKPEFSRLVRVRAKRAIQFFQFFLQGFFFQFSHRFSSKALEIYFFYLLLIKNCKYINFFIISLKKLVK